MAFHGVPPSLDEIREVVASMIGTRVCITPYDGLGAVASRDNSPCQCGQCSKRQQHPARALTYRDHWAAGAYPRDWPPTEPDHRTIKWSDAVTLPIVVWVGPNVAATLSARWRNVTVDPEVDGGDMPRVVWLNTCR